MTSPDTTTLPDIEAWLEGEIEKPCTLAVNGKPCGRPARWLGYARCDRCDQGTDQRFICEVCHPYVTRGRFPHGGPSDCWQPVTVTWIERIKR